MNKVKIYYPVHIYKEIIGDLVTKSTTLLYRNLIWDMRNRFTIIRNNTQRIIFTNL